MSTGAAPRWPGPAAGSSLGERIAAAALLLAAAAAAAIWLTAAVAAAFAGGSPPGFADAASALARLPGHLSDPRAAFPSGARAQLPGPAGFYAAAALVCATLLAFALLVARLLPWLRDRPVFAMRSSEGDSGARWARRGDLRGLAVRGPEPGRVTLGRAHGRLVAAEPRQSAIVIAPTQSLKTTGLAIPSILEWQGPVLATSVKTDLLRDTIDRRRRLGDVLVFDPTESTGLDGASWSPLSESADWHGAQRTAAELCAAARPGGSTLADADFWYSAAAKLLAPVLLAATIVEEGFMADVVRWVDTQEIDEVRDALHEHRDEDALIAAEATWARDERQRSSIYTTAETVLAAYADPRVLAAAVRTDSDYGRPRERDCPRSRHLPDAPGSPVPFPCAPDPSPRAQAP